MKEEESFQEETNQQAEIPPCEIHDSNEWNRLQDFENRDHAEELSKEEVKTIIQDQDF